MISTHFHIDGITGAREIISILPNLGREAMEEVATSIRALVRGRTPVGIRSDDEHTPGTMKGSWSTVAPTSTGFTFGSTTPYARVLEEGGYRGVGPRTVATEGGIYSRQAPGGMLMPILDDQQTITKVMELVISEMIRGMEGVG